MANVLPVRRANGEFALFLWWVYSPIESISADLCFDVDTEAEDVSSDSEQAGFSF